MARGLDHIVHAVSDIEAAASFYRGCGFQVGSRNRHPWGTHNHIVQLPGFFIEILTVAEPEKLGDDGLSQKFGAYQRDSIARGDGLSMLIVESHDIAADVADFARRGIGASEALPFERQAILPDGREKIVGFTLAFASDRLAPRIGYAACMQHNPKAFWNASYQQHPNGVTAIEGVIIAAKDASAHLGFLQALTGVSESESRTDGVLLRTPRGHIEVQTPDAFGARTGNVPDCGEGALLTGLRFATTRLDPIEHRLREQNIPALRRGASLIVPPQAAFGATLIFEQAGLS